ncbi:MULTISPECIES: alpha/beta fold hydrolase [unclassified Streptomyces]|uniref:alpha/beta fold hydrolase n=1 Tax=unclassified Streptomyces TaxID=2593676 RepID=UPI000CD58D51|nr:MULTISPECIES: alpha/beta hydrolase [unclassified Streptomyces]
MPTDAVLTQDTSPVAEPHPAEAVLIEERSLVLDGFRFTCRVVDRGTPVTEPILILGGSMQDRNSYVRHEKWLSTVGRVITVDLPGYGGADFLPGEFGVDFLAAATRHLLDELGVPRVNMVGACYGGAIGLRFAQHHPERVARLMLVGMTTHVTAEYTASMERWAAMIERDDTAGIARELAEGFVSPLGAGRVRKHAAMARLVHQQITGQNAEQRRNSAEHNSRMLRHDWYRPEPVPEVPSLVVTGEHDTLTTPAMGREVARSLPRARFLTIDETDHLAPMERIADFADLVVRFCTDASLDELPYCSSPETLGTALTAR